MTQLTHYLPSRHCKLRHQRPLPDLTPTLNNSSVGFKTRSARPPNHQNRESCVKTEKKVTRDTPAPMKARAASLLPLLAGVAVLCLVPTALAHGEEHEHANVNNSSSGGGMPGMPGMNGMTASDADKPLPEDQYPPTYFSHPDHKAAIWAHIAVMVLAWVFALPAGKPSPSTTTKTLTYRPNHAKTPI